MTPCHIVVLEDTQARVDWLKHTFPNVEIAHCVDVVQFAKALRCTPDMIILDHDLAGTLGESHEAAAVYERGEATDMYGLTGMDAARMCDRHTPVLVWSMNPVWGPRTRNLLAERDVPVAYYPFRADLNMILTIKDVYFSSTGVWLK